MKIVGLSFAIFAILSLYSSPSLGESLNIHLCVPPHCTRVTSVEHEPFLSDGVGYIKDLLDALNIGTYEFTAPPDGRYGAENPEVPGEWTGMIGMLTGNPPTADVIATDLTITSKRSEAVEFTMPFMSVPITVLLKKTTGGRHHKHRGRYHSVEEMLDNPVGLGYFRFMVVNGGSTYHMLKNSSVALHKKIFKRISQNSRRSLVRSNREGMQRLLDENDPHLGMLMEGSAADYFKATKCELYSVGNLGDRFYGLAFPKPIQTKPNPVPFFSKQILKLQESGKLMELKERWFGDNGTCHGQRHPHGRGMGSDGPCAAIKSGLSEIKSEISLLRYEIRNAHNGGNMTIGPRIAPPLKQLGEDCGSCFCPPTFTAGDCAPGLECKNNPMLPDAPGKCVKKLETNEGMRCGGRGGKWCGEGLRCIGKALRVDGQGTCVREATNCPPGVGIMNCFEDPCSSKICPHPDATCVSNYCGGCNAVWYDQTGQNILNCTVNSTKVTPAKMNGEDYCESEDMIRNEADCQRSSCCHWNTWEAGDGSFNGDGRCWSDIGTGICTDIGNDGTGVFALKRCCYALTAECLACQAGQTKQTYCRNNYNVVGCEELNDQGADVGERCYSNYFTGTKNCKPWLQCDSQPNSDGYSGACVCTPGTTVPAPDGCNKCTCSDDGQIIGCTRKMCVGNN